MGPKGVTQISTFVFPTNVSEDCLWVNIWTKPQTGEKKKAVLLWIYGGGFNMGDSGSANTNGASFANNQDLVVASINYRINIFGYPGAPTLASKNPGFLDQRLGIEWVRDNIAAFGGDPERITIYGESAGGASVDHYAYAWYKDPIVNGFIASSGTAMMTQLTMGPGGRSGGRSGSHWYTLSKTLGCGGEEAGAATVKCVQSKSMKDVLSAMPSQGGAVAGIPGGFGPLPDEQTVFSDIYAKAKRGELSRKVAFNHFKFLKLANMLSSSLCLSVRTKMRPSL
jgi:cholinesterase